MRLFIFLACLLTVTEVFAHGEIHDQLKSTDERIKKDPNNAQLYIHRGRLYLDDGHLAHAQADFRQALKLNPDNRAGHYFLGDALLKNNDAPGAEHEAKAFIALLTSADKGGLVRGYRLLGRSLQKQGKHVDAANAFRTAVDNTAEPGPEQFIECASAFSAAGIEHRAKALQTLDEGMKKLGLLPTLQEAAIDVEIQAGNTDGAVSRLDSLIALGKRREYLLYQKAKILTQARRPDDAKRYYEEALEVIEGLKPQHRNSKGAQTLKKDIEAGLKALQI